ncbi:MAG: hypothetical protein VB118_04780 [Oscillospiraceae bacterium]|nr:hypothetical protein [Oscillospiraceae bacterium]
MADEFMTRDMCDQIHKNFDERFERDKERIQSVEKLCEAIAGLIIELKHTNKMIESHESRIKALEDRPIKRWDGLVSTCIAAIAGGLIGYLISAIL